MQVQVGGKITQVKLKQFEHELKEHVREVLDAVLIFK